MIVSAAEKLAMVHPNSRGEMTLEEIIYRYMTDADLVVTEGYKTGVSPRSRFTGVREAQTSSARPATAGSRTTG